MATTLFAVPRLAPVVTLLLLPFGSLRGCLKVDA